MSNQSSSSFADRLMGRIWRSDADLPERTRRRVILYLIPFLFFLYILAYLDRANVSVAQAGMVKAPDEAGLAFTKTICGFGAGIFFWGYWILEIPSTKGVLTYGARWVFARILVLWGLSCTLIGFIGLAWFNSLFVWLPGVESWPLLHHVIPHKATPDTVQAATTLVASIPGSLGAGSPLPSVVIAANVPHQPDGPSVAQFYFLRFMLGLFEGGFFPAVIMYLSIWFRPRDRARAIATFMSAIPVSLMLGTPLSQYLLSLSWGGLAGWRWVFILQGIVPVFVGFLTLYFLPDRPEKADWLPPDEKDWLTQELARDQAAKTGHGHGWHGQTGIVLLMTVYYFCMNVTSYGLSMFLPDIIKTQSGFEENLAGYLAGVPYVFGLLGMLVNGWHSDRSGERIKHVATPLVVLSLGLFLTAVAVWQKQGLVAYLLLTLVVGTCMYAHLPAFWPIPTIFMGAAAAAAAIGFINMMGNMGGFVGPTLFGSAAQKKEYASGLFTLAPFPLVSVAIILFIGYIRRDRLAASKT